MEHERGGLIGQFKHGLSDVFGRDSGEFINLRL